MRTIIISKPTLSWLTVQALVNKYHARLSIVGHKIILRADRAEDLVRILSAVRVLTS